MNFDTRLETFYDIVEDVYPTRILDIELFLQSQGVLSLQREGVRLPEDMIVSGTCDSSNTVLPYANCFYEKIYFKDGGSSELDDDPFFPLGISLQDVDANMADWVARKFRFQALLVTEENHLIWKNAFPNTKDCMLLLCQM